MLPVGKAILSLDVIEKHFTCDVSKCKGICCVAGESGAPLLENEIKTIKKILPIILPYVPKTSKKIIEEKNFYYTDDDGDVVTQLVDGKECVFVYFKNNIAHCAIEKAWFEKKISFRKPLSCHLFPIRIKHHKNFDAVNFEKLNMCKPAIENGNITQQPVYDFCKDSLIRIYGVRWYKQLVNIVKKTDLINKI